MIIRRFSSYDRAPTSDVRFCARNTAFVLLICAAFPLPITLRAQHPTVNDSTFRHVALPWECARADRWTNDQVWRGKRPDTAYVPPTGAPRPRAVVHAIQRCVEKFSVSSTSTRDLPG